MALVQQSLCEVGAYEAGYTGDEDAHCLDLVRDDALH